ncbi:hypothetical protein U9M48_034057, partial [Paspalum notatum var. saurae]
HESTPFVGINRVWRGDFLRRGTGSYIATTTGCSVRSSGKDGREGWKDEHSRREDLLRDTQYHISSATTSSMCLKGLLSSNSFQNKDILGDGVEHVEISLEFHPDPALLAIVVDQYRGELHIIVILWILEVMASRVCIRADGVDIKKMVCSITNKLNSYRSLLENVHKDTRACQICRVPAHFRGVEHTAYEPIVLCIGPYHHGSKHLLAMEKIKWEYLDHILKLNCEVSLRDYLRAVAKLEKLTRTCYSAGVTMERKSFLQMLLLDSCFILITIYESISTDEAFLGTHIGGMIEAKSELQATSAQAENEVTKACGHGYSEDISVLEVEITEVRSNQRPMNDNRKIGRDSQNYNDYNKVGDWYSLSAWRDIFLMENQIPFFIIEKIYQVATGKEFDVLPLLVDRACTCVEDILCHFPLAIQEPNRPKNFQHLLHLCHMYLRPSQRPCDDSELQGRPGYLHCFQHFMHKFLRIDQKQKQQKQNGLRMRQLDCFQSGELPVRWRRASQYHEAGVTIKRRQWNKHSRHSLLDIKFSNGVIEVPCFPMDENTESLFKNLLAFEQMGPQFGNDIASYILFMTELVNTPEDATLFANNGIILHMLDSDDEVPLIFNKLSKQVCFTYDSYHYLKYLCYILESHYQSRLNRWIAWLWLNHFSNPWLALAVFAAIIVLVCTVVQTVYTVLAYVKPSSYVMKTTSRKILMSCLPHLCDNRQQDMANNAMVMSAMILVLTIGLVPQADSRGMLAGSPEGAISHHDPPDGIVEEKGYYPVRPISRPPPISPCRAKAKSC